MQVNYHQKPLMVWFSLILPGPAFTIPKRLEHVYPILSVQVSPMSSTKGEVFWSRGIHWQAVQDSSWDTRMQHLVRPGLTWLKAVTQHAVLLIETHSTHKVNTRQYIIWCKSAFCTESRNISQGVINFAACCSFHHSASVQVLLLASGNIFPLSSCLK